MTELSRRKLLTGAAGAAVATAFHPTMSTPALAAAPMSGQQAPSYYRQKVGDFEVTVVSDGVTRFPLADNFIVNAKKEEVNAALEAAYLPKDQLANQYTPTVINTGSKLVAIDTGTGLGAFEKTKGAQGQFHKNLVAAGIDPKAVDVVVISHFHPDHFSGLRGTDGSPLFPNAELMVPATEWAFWMDDARMNAAPDALKGLFQLIRNVFGPFGNKVTRFEAGKEIVPGISTIATPGHTPGHTSFLITSGNGRLLVQADVSIMPYLFVRNPGWHVRFDMDGKQAEETRRKLYDMAAAEKLPIVGYHWPFPATGYVEKDGNGYRVHPIIMSPVL